MAVSRFAQATLMVLSAVPVSRDRASLKRVGTAEPPFRPPEITSLKMASIVTRDSTARVNGVFRSSAKRLKPPVGDRLETDRFAVSARVQGRALILGVTLNVELVRPRTSTSRSAPIAATRPSVISCCVALASDV